MPQASAASQPAVNKELIHLQHHDTTHSSQKTGPSEHRENGHDENSFIVSSKCSSLHAHTEKHDEDMEADITALDTSPAYSVFTKREKLFVVILAALGGFFSPLSANIYFPALPALARDFDVSSTLMNLTLTSYMIFQGLAPAIFGDFADQA